MADTYEETREEAQEEMQEEAQDTRAALSGQDALRENGMMLHLLDSLASGENIGHYGQLVFTMVARHFLDDDELIELLLGDPSTTEEQAVTLLEQVKARDYSPPRREKILQFQAQQDFAIIPNPDDPDAGNVYRDLHFPEHVYAHISEYRDQKAHAHEEEAAANQA